jgi:hypothetical protein
MLNHPRLLRSHPSLSKEGRKGWFEEERREAAGMVAG